MMGREATTTEPILSAEGLTKRFPIRRGPLRRTVAEVHAVDGVSFSIDPGETLGLVGESGCGKSTLGRMVLKLIEPTSGRIRLEGRDITGLSRAEMRPLRRRAQMVFQDPYSSLNPRMTAAQIVSEPLEVHGIGSGREREERVAQLFARVGLRPDQMRNFANQFSGGQRQRLGIARALALEPTLIVLDEPVSALDVSIQAQVINLLADLQAELGLSLLFIAHDLAVVQHISRRVAVLYLGRIVEIGDRRSLFAEPLHPYTEALLAAVPVPVPRARRRATRAPLGEIPSPINPPPGCHFHTRCPLAAERCREEAPRLRPVGAGRHVACHFR
jgi:peptide/nickel transport system ATP-binding protein/oligopeptide transport system ATP-binding protein